MSTSIVFNVINSLETVFFSHIFLGHQALFIFAHLEFCVCMSVGVLGLAFCEEQIASCKRKIKSS